MPNRGHGPSGRDGGAAAGSGRAAEVNEDMFLANMPLVLTGSRLEQPLMDAPNAITVIDREMIKASGFRNVAELFRLVPGFQVNLISGYFQAVSHGLADQYARRMQVLVDGRSVYMPFFGGVRWDSLPLTIADIERIEVSRGPNAATYGANAFTGIINIITRHPQDAPRHTASLTAGENGVREAMYRQAGGDADYQYRLTGAWSGDEGFELQHDSARIPLLNYRGELYLGDLGSLGIQLGFAGGRRQLGSAADVQNQPHDQKVLSHYEQLDWQQLFVGGDSLELRLSHSILDNRERVPTLGSTYNIGVVVTTAPLQFDYDVWTERSDLELQYKQEHSENLRSVLGLALHRDAVRSQRLFATTEDQVNVARSLFGHLEWRFQPDWLLNLGGMAESHDIGQERFSPRVSLHWQPTTHHGLRLGYSRAWRNPVQIEENANWILPFQIIAPAPFVGPYYFPFIVGKGGLKPEGVTSRELAYLGVWPEQGLNLDVRVFRDVYHNLISLDKSAGQPNRSFVNAEQASLWGTDGQLRWQWSRDGQIIANFAYTHSRASFIFERYEDSTPTRQYGVLAMQRLPGRWDVSLGYYWMDGMEVVGGSPIRTTRRVDMRIAHPFDLGGARMELALVFQGLADDYHEFDDNNYNLFDRRGYVSLQAEF